MCTGPSWYEVCPSMCSWYSFMRCWQQGESVKISVVVFLQHWGLPSQWFYMVPAIFLRVFKKCVSTTVSRWQVKLVGQFHKLVLLSSVYWHWASSALLPFLSFFLYSLAYLPFWMWSLWWLVPYLKQGVQFPCKVHKTMLLWRVQLWLTYVFYCLWRSGEWQAN